MPSFWFYSISAVPTHRTEVTEEAGFRSLRWVHQKLARTNLVYKVPDFCYYLGSNLLPLVIADNCVHSWFEVVISPFTRSMKTSVTTIFAAADNVVTTTRDLMVRQYYLF